VVATLLGRPDLSVLTILLGALIFVRHDANIRRLMRGEEPRIGRKKG
jgi:acyl phosphate:glycerol-3-phosphate acyltransferase